MKNWSILIPVLAFYLGMFAGFFIGKRSAESNAGTRTVHKQPAKPHRKVIHIHIPVPAEEQEQETTPEDTGKAEKTKPELQMGTDLPKTE